MWGIMSCIDVADGKDNWMYYPWSRGIAAAHYTLPSSIIPDYVE